MLNHDQYRYFQVGGITVKFESDLPITAATFHPKFRAFETSQPGKDVISLHHHFALPDLRILNSGIELYRKPPWLIRRNGDAWIYLHIAASRDETNPEKVAFFNEDYSRGEIFHRESNIYEEGRLDSLTLFPTDQILLGRVLADRQGCLIHSSGVILREKGFLFLGHSEAGKSTITKMLSSRAEILCDDRIIVRRWPDHFRIHGSWSHGEVPTVSASSAPLLGIFFLRKSGMNRVTEVRNRREILSRLLACLIKPLCTADWWEKVLNVTEMLSSETRFYDLEFDKSGRIADVLENLI